MFYREGHGVNLEGRTLLYWVSVASFSALGISADFARFCCHCRTGWVVRRDFSRKVEKYRPIPCFKQTVDRQDKWLPIESVLRCRSVCKLWYNWGYDASFIDLHLSKSIQQPPHLVLALKPEKSYTKLSSLLMMNGMNGEGDNCKIRQISLGFVPIKDGLFDIVGSCNGFICLSRRPYRGSIFIYNPITVEGILLPYPRPRYSDNYRISRVGFGFDRLSNKYKVVRVHQMPPYAEEEDYKNFAEIITVDANSYWRKLDFPRSFRFLGGHPLFLDGILYWLVHLPNPSCCENIVAVDIESEKHWIIECPPPRHHSRKRNSLIHMDGINLSQPTYNMSGEYAQQDWEQFFVMAKIGHDTFLLELLSGSKIVMRKKCVYNSSIVLYSCIKQQCLSVQGTWNNSSVERHWMVPSLKSLNDEIDSWIDEEDRLLVRMVQQYGVGNWAEIAHNFVIRNWVQNKYVQVIRTGKQCQKRWHNHLCMNIKAIVCDMDESPRADEVGTATQSMTLEGATATQSMTHEGATATQSMTHEGATATQSMTHEGATATQSMTQPRKSGRVRRRPSTLRDYV
ncbi:hypothetical protein NE237_029947 [Protea cynaroides]|uniref:Uncharacterized protein n=1 Tax=Protea cynaroides TaxID=273540 RepID=A0A9Q0GT91_9MAGN|nr:hypothetical protein NE237_029947 [Protea cynaroides]